jgi:hypothetical protein
VSADNGFILRRDEAGKYVLQMYFASAEEYPPIDSIRAGRFDTLEEAIAKFEEVDSTDDYPCEYGLTVRIREVTKAE